MLFVDRELAQSRFDFCKSCEHFFNSTSSCKKCGCFMKLKVKIPNSTCPVGKW
jgi:hypothetical protein